MSVDYVIGIEWRPIQWAPRYEVSETGQVRKKINDTHPERKQYALMKLEIDKDGYHRVQINRLHRLVHRVVFEAFVGKLNASLVVAHLDGTRSNNCYTNLTQVSQRENIFHKKSHGTWQAGEKHPRALLNNDQARRIREALSSAARSKTGRIARGEAQRIAGEHKVSIHCVYEIRRGGYVC